MHEQNMIENKLERLRLTGMVKSHHQRLKQAQEEHWSYSAFLDTLLADEVDRRNHQQLARRLAKSQLNPSKTLESFDFTFNAKVQAASIRELACCKFLEERQNIFLIGPSGVGKSHLAEALGHEACRRGVDVLCYRTGKLFDWLYSGKGDGSYRRKLDQVIKVPLLILDDFGLQSMPESHQEDLYEVICGRYEKYSLIITSNRDISEWPSVFANPLLATAAMDRLVHKGIEIVIEGNSYRLDQFRKQAKKVKKT